MSTAARVQRRMTPWAWAGMVLSVLLIALGVALLAQPDDGPSPPGRVPLHRPATEPSIKQARWHVRAFPVGRLPKKARPKFRTQREHIASLVKHVYEGLFLAPSDLRKVVGGLATAPASEALIKTRAGVPPNAKRVKTLARVAKIWIHPSLHRAAARVNVRARATLKGRTRRVSHVATLWLERTKRWKIIGYEFTQRGR